MLPRLTLPYREQRWWRVDTAEGECPPESEFLQLEAALEELQLQKDDLEGDVGLLDVSRCMSASLVSSSSA